MKLSSTNVTFLLEIIWLCWLLCHWLALVLDRLLDASWGKLLATHPNLRCFIFRWLGSFVDSYRIFTWTKGK